MAYQKWNRITFFLALLMGVGAPISFSVSRNAWAADPSCELIFKKKKLCAQINWVIPPKQVELPTEKDAAEFTLTFKKKTVAGATPISTPLAESVYVKLFMPSMGHGSHPTQVIPLRDSQGNLVPGQYQVKNVLFSMPGDWLIQVQLKKADQVLDQANLPFKMR
jgi:hypothetical protein